MNIAGTPQFNADQLPNNNGVTNQYGQDGIYGSQSNLPGAVTMTESHDEAQIEDDIENQAQSITNLYENGQTFTLDEIQQM